MWLAVCPQTSAETPKVVDSKGFQASAGIVMSTPLYVKLMLHHSKLRTFYDDFVHIEIKKCFTQDEIKNVHHPNKNTFWCTGFESNFHRLFIFCLHF